MGRFKERCTKKKRPILDVESNIDVNAPHSFVLHRGQPCPYVKILSTDFRRMMDPFTASTLTEKKKNKIKDFINVSGIFHVSHMCIFQKTKTQVSFKALRLPRGPTLSFKVHQFTLTKDVIASMKKQYVTADAFRKSPVVILNNFTGEGKHLKLMATTFQNMFPTINLATVHLSNMKRCILMSYDPVSKLIDVRHYAITVTPAGLSSLVKKVVMGKIPNLARYEDIADFIVDYGTTDSEYEDDANQVILSQTLKSRGNMEDAKSAIKLHELGPRLTLELVKIEEGLFTGEVLYHQNVVKTDEEIMQKRAEQKKKKLMKEARKREQEKNVREKVEKKTNPVTRLKRKFDMMKETNKIADINDAEENDDDVAYYIDEIGQKPDEDLFTGNQSQNLSFIPKYKQIAKKQKRKRSN